MLEAPHALYWNNYARSKTMFNITPFIQNLSIAIFLQVSCITLFFAGVLVLELVIRKIHGVEKR